MAHQVTTASRLAGVSRQPRHHLKKLDFTPCPHSLARSTRRLGRTRFYFLRALRLRTRFHFVSSTGVPRSRCSLATDSSPEAMLNDTVLSSNPASLCLTCLHRREVVSAKGGSFMRCRLFPADKRFPKFPPQPVLRCEGWLESRTRDEEQR